MADTLTLSMDGRAGTAPQRPRPVMSPNQLQAYFLARETLRRLKPAPTPFVPPDVRLRASPRAGPQPAAARTPSQPGFTATPQ